MVDFTARNRKEASSKENTSGATKQLKMSPRVVAAEVASWQEIEFGMMGVEGGGFGCMDWRRRREVMKLRGES